MQDIIEGIICSIVFTNAENGYSVIRLETTEGIVTAAGIIPGVSLGERLLMTGVWGTHPQYGEQFKAESFEVKPPSGAEEIYCHLASGAVKNIGPGRARDIVDRFGEASLSIIENDPDKLSVIKGISLRTARKIGSDYQKQAGLRRLISFFRNYDIAPLIATRVYKHYGNESLEAVKNNPYIITSELYGSPFHEADAIAIDLGFASDCNERISAALIFTLVHNLGNGHTFIPKNKLTAAVGGLISVPQESINETLDTLCLAGDIIIDTVAGLDACYLKHIHEAECFVAERLTMQLGIRNEELGIISQESGDGVRKGSGVRGQGLGDERCKDGVTYSDMQLEALKLAAEQNVLVLTGGPGTGKTTTIRGILRLFDKLDLKTCLCAPTGRAAKRLSELSAGEAATIHRLLGASLDESGNPAFEHDETNPLEADAVIIDECSMIDILLMDALLRALKPSCRIILVGDADQLPPIGPGNMFTDVIRSGVIAVVKLTEIFRQAQDSGIVRSAHNVINGIMPDFSEKCPDLFFLSRRSEQELAQTVADLCSERLPKNMGIDRHQIQILSPTRKREAGTVSLNNILQEKLNPRSAKKAEKAHGAFVFRTGDKVMQIKNNYDILTVAHGKNRKTNTGAGVYNGDTGYIRDINHDKETVTVDFEDKLVTYSFDQLAELEPAYAITVHKAQGSEYQAVILAMTAAAPPLLTRGVLYTAMTRAKSLLVIVGSLSVMNKMVQNDRRQKRYSGLRARLAER